jgi:peroxiredoxin
MKEKLTEMVVNIQVTQERAPLGAPSGKVAEDIANAPIRLQSRWKKRLTAREMESVTAICDTFLPSINAPSECSTSVQNFYQTAASMVGTPEIVSSSNCWFLQLN